MNELSIVVVASDSLIPRCAAYRFSFQTPKKTRNGEQRATNEFDKSASTFPKQKDQKRQRNHVSSKSM